MRALRRRRPHLHTARRMRRRCRGPAQWHTRKDLLPERCCRSASCSPKFRCTAGGRRGLARLEEAAGGRRRRRRGASPSTSGPRRVLITCSSHLPAPLCVPPGRGRAAPQRASWARLLVHPRRAYRCITRQSKREGEYARARGDKAAAVGCWHPAPPSPLSRIAAWIPLGEEAPAGCAEILSD